MWNTVLFCESSGMLPLEKQHIRTGIFDRLLIFSAPALFTNPDFYA